MRFRSIIFQQCLLLLLALFLVRGFDDTDESDSAIQTLSTGEVPTAFVRNKIDSHDVSVFGCDIE